MSTIIKMIPKEHATKRTTGIILTNDGIIRTRVEDPVGTATDKQFNFSANAEGTFREINNEPVVSVSSQKIGADARFIITVNEFYDPTLVGENIPQERFLWYDYKTKSDEAPSSTAAQTFPIDAFWTSGGTPSSPTVAFPGSYTDQVIPTPSLYTSLASTENRRNYLKQKILDNINNPDFPIWVSRSAPSPSTTAEHILEHGQRQESLIYWLECLTRAISDDDNLNSEQKFNFLNGECSLSAGDVSSTANPLLGSLIYNSRSDRDHWLYQRLGSVGANTPWTYSPPVLQNIMGVMEWVPRPYATIILTSASDIGDDWLGWLRS